MKCHPNPTSGTTTATYFLRDNADVKIELQDVNGRSLAMIEKKNSTEGEHQIEIDLSRFQNGMYIVALIINDNAVVTQKIILNK